MINLIALLGLVASAQDIQVKAGGDVGKALAQAGKGVTITLAGGKYAPSQLHLGSSGAGVTLRSRPGERAILDFGKRGGLYIKANGFTLKDVDILNAKQFGVDVDASNVTLDGCRILGSGGDAVKLSPGNWQGKDYNRGATIVNCEIGANADFEGIDCVGQDDAEMLI